jgi:hypothetical protein
MRRAMIMLTVVAVMVFVAGGIALAKNISCARQDGNVCLGTNNMDNITGTNRADTIKARGGNDTVTARGGRDKVFGQNGGDVLEGGPGNDTLNAGPNTPSVLEGVGGGEGDDTLVESTGPDRFFFGVDWGQDQITGNGDQMPLRDNDDVCFVCSGGPSPSNPLTINLATGQAFETAAGSTGANTVTWTAGIIENATGGNGGDTIMGSSVSNIVNGFAGADNINVSGDPSSASDTVDCGGGPSGDGATDTVTKDSGDFLTPTGSCASDTIINVP